MDNRDRMSRRAFDIYTTQLEMYNAQILDDLKCERAMRKRLLGEYNRLVHMLAVVKWLMVLGCVAVALGAVLLLSAGG